MAPHQKPPNLLVDMVINRPVRHKPCTVGKVSGPATQQIVQPVTHFGPGIVIAGDKNISDPFLDPLHAFLRRTCPQIPVTILSEMVRSEAVAKKVETFPSGIAQAGLRFVEGEAEPGHDMPGPLQRLIRMSAAEDDKVVGIIHDPGLEPLIASAGPPMAEEAVDVTVGQQGADHPTLWRAAGTALSADHPPLPSSVRFLDRRLEPEFNQAQDIPINNPPGN